MAVALDMAAEVKGDITCDTTSIPSDINPKRVRLSHSLNTVKKVLDTCLSFGWEVLEGIVCLLGLGLAGGPSRRVALV